MQSEHPLTRLFPGIAVLDVSVQPETTILTAQAVQTTAVCPRCQTISARVHSYYTRKPHDLPILGTTVRLLYMYDAGDVSVQPVLLEHSPSPFPNSLRPMPNARSACQQPFNISPLHSVARLALVKVSAKPCLPARRPCCVSRVAFPFPSDRPLASWLLTISPFAGDADMERFWSTVRTIDRWNSSLSAVQRPLPPGCASIRALRSSHVTEQPSMLVVRRTERLMHFRFWIGGISLAIFRRPSFACSIVLAHGFNAS